MVFTVLPVYRMNQRLACRTIWLQKDCMKTGYARVSTIDLNPNSQRDALKLAGCE